MYAMNVNYPKSDDSTFDADYYLNSHIPLVAKLMADHGFKGYVLHEGKGSAPGDNEQSYAGVELLFDSAESLQGGLAANGPEIMSDISNYTNVAPEVSYSNATVNLF